MLLAIRDDSGPGVPVHYTMHSQDINMYLNRQNCLLQILINLKDSSHSITVVLDLVVTTYALIVLSEDILILISNP